MKGGKIARAGEKAAAAVKITPEELLKALQKKFGAKIDAKVARHEQGANKKHAVQNLWIKADARNFKDVVEELRRLHPNPHFAVISGSQTGDIVELNYHFSFNYAEPKSEFFASVKVALPKSSLKLPTITNLIPGALVSEREVQEMFGVKIEGIPDARRMFLDESFPKGVYPWRRDETGPKKLVRKINESDG
jgi:membrane-bound hydrogenase subunit beta